MAITEAQFQEQVTQLAEYRGWAWVHFRPARVANGWRTPVEGPLGKGWVDLFMARRRDGRFLLVELKAPGKYPTAAQREVLDLLRETAGGRSRTIEVCVWRPADWPQVEETLR